MDKSLLLNFISKYKIADIDDVVWNFSEKSLSTSIRTLDKSVIGYIKMFNVNDENFNGKSLGIKNSSIVLKYLGLLKDNVELFYGKSKDNTPSQLHLKDGNLEFYVSLASTESVRKVPQQKSDLPTEYDISIKITDDFIDTFSKGKSVFSELAKFSVRVINGKCKVFLGRDEVLYNRMEICPETNKVTDIKDLFFNIAGFSDALLANKGVNAEFLISSEGVGILEYKNDSYHAKYIFLAAENDD